MRSVDDVAADYDWNQVYRQVLAYALAKLGGRTKLADAEQIAQQALEQLFDHEHYDWDPDGGVPLLDDLRSRVNGLVSNLRKKEKRRGAHVEFDEGGDGATTCSPEAQAISEEEARQAIADLLNRLSDDDVGSEMLLHMADGIHKPADLAAVMGRNVREIYKARQRMKPHVDAVAAALGRRTS